MARPAQIFSFVVETEEGKLRYPDRQQRPGPSAPDALRAAHGDRHLRAAALMGRPLRRRATGRDGPVGTASLRVLGSAAVGVGGRGGRGSGEYALSPLARPSRPCVECLRTARHPPIAATSIAETCTAADAPARALRAWGYGQPHPQTHGGPSVRPPTR